MIFQRFEDEGLSQFSYLVASDATRQAAVVDPRRDVEPYLRFARDHGLRIAHVAETHVHADYASGALDLAERAGARLHESAYDDGERYEVTFVHQPLREGDALDLGDVRLRTVHTPGHTPEHISFLVYDDAEDARDPVRFLTGDFLLAGAVGRPDLLGEDEARRLAEALYHGLRRVLPPLPDHVRVHPAHGSGSMCGAGMREAPETTLGQERSTNPYLAGDLDRQTFVERLLDSVPPYPAYYRRMKHRNAGGAGLTRSWPEPVALTADQFARRAGNRHVVIDTRHQLAFGGGHVPGALGIGLGADLSTWAGWVVPNDRPLLLVGEQDRDVSEAVLRLARVGLDAVDGFLRGGMDAWLSDARRVRSIPQLPPRALEARRRSGPLTVLDVRTDEEWEAGHVPGAVHVMAGRLPRVLDHGPPKELTDPHRPLAVVCGTGYRSTVAASVLEARGYRAVFNVPGGMTAWEAAGLPLSVD